MVAVWNAGVELANWKQCEAVALATCNLEGWEPGRWSMGKKFIILFHFYTNGTEYFALPLVDFCAVVLLLVLWGKLKPGTQFDGRVKFFFTFLSPFIWHNPKKNCIKKPTHDWKTSHRFFILPYLLYLFSQFFGNLVDWASFRTPTHFTLNREDAEALALILHQLPSAPQASRQTGGLYKTPGVKYIIEMLTIAYHFSWDLVGDGEEMWAALSLQYLMLY